MINQCVSSLYSTGRTTGIVLESGYEVTSIMPIFEGYPIYDCSYKLNLAGKNLTEYFKKLIQYRIPESNIHILEQFDVRKYKEEYCYISKEFSEESKKAKKSNENKQFIKKVELPDHSVIEIDYERIQVPELMFKPTIDSLQFTPIQNCIEKSINNVPIDLKKEMWNNIVLSGGNTMFSQFSDRLRQELLLLASNNSDDLNIEAKPERR